MSDGESTPFGRILLAGEVVDDEPFVPGPLRAMDGVIVSLVTAGRGSYRYPDGRTVPIEAPMLTVVKPGDAHWYGTGPGERWTEWFAVAEGPVFDLLSDNGRLQWSGPRTLSRTTRAADLALLLRTVAPAAGAEQQVWALAQWLAGALAPDVDTETAHWDEVITRLTADLDQPLSMQELASDLGADYDRFRRQFRRRFGRAPLAYRNERRLDAAATLLRVTNLTSREIARRLGFSDEFHLSRRFRKRYGVAPSAYRHGQG